MTIFLWLVIAAAVLGLAIKFAGPSCGMVFKVLGIALLAVIILAVIFGGIGCFTIIDCARQLMLESTIIW